MNLTRLLSNQTEHLKAYLFSLFPTQIFENNIYKAKIRWPFCNLKRTEFSNQLRLKCLSPTLSIYVCVSLDYSANENKIIRIRITYI